MTHSSRSTGKVLATVLTRGVSAASIASLLFASSCASTPSFLSRKSKRPDTMPLTEAGTGKAIPSYADRLEAAKEAQKSIPKPGESQVEHAALLTQLLVVALEYRDWRIIDHEKRCDKVLPDLTN